MHRNNERPLTTPKLPFVENGLEWLLMTLSCRSADAAFSLHEH
jgi:hypothetical protein